MTAPGPDYFASSPRLRARRTPGLPAARRPTATAVVGVLVAASTLAIGVGGTNGPGAGIVAAAAAVIIGAGVSWILHFVVRSEGRIRLRALREQVGADAVAVRSTAGFAASRPIERDLRDERRKPGRAFQLLTIEPDGFELRERPAGGANGVAFVPWASVEAIRVGSADFSDVSERAILIAAEVDDRAFLLGLSPLDDSTGRIRQAREDEYLRLIHELIRRSEAVHPLSDVAPRG